MIITILAEPRSGSTNLANAFFNNKDFTVLFLPSDSKSKWYINDEPKNYYFTTKYLMIKEDFYNHKNFKQLLNISDKIIFLYRENSEEQIWSWINAKTTDNWDGMWQYNEKIMLNKESEIEYFLNLKNEFSILMNNTPNSISISYEDIYEKNKFNKIKEFLGEDIAKNINFPIGKRYRINVNKKKLL